MQISKRNRQSFEGKHPGTEFILKIVTGKNYLLNKIGFFIYDRMIECKAHIKKYQVKALPCLDKEIKLEVVITEKESKLQEILKELALIKADELVKMRIE